MKNNCVVDDKRCCCWLALGGAALMLQAERLFSNLNGLECTELSGSQNLLWQHG